MSIRRFSVITAAAVLLCAPAAMAQWSSAPSHAWSTSEQAPPPPAAAPAAPQAPAPARSVRVPDATAPQAPTPGLEMRRARGQSVNVKVELTITDQVGTKAPDKKNVSMVVVDGERGSIRSNAEVIQKIEEVVAGQTSVKSNVRSVPLAVDVWPEIEGSRVRLRLSLEYDLLGETVANRVSIRETVAVMLENGVPLVVALSAEPMTDRRVTLEVKASIMR